MVQGVSLCHGWHHQCNIIALCLVWDEDALERWFEVHVQGWWEEIRLTCISACIVVPREKESKTMFENTFT